MGIQNADRSTQESGGGVEHSSAQDLTRSIGELACLSNNIDGWSELRIYCSTLELTLARMTVVISSLIARINSDRGVLEDLIDRTSQRR